MKLEKKFINCLACPEGCRRKFKSKNALNNHLTKYHDANYKIDLDDKGRAYKVRNRQRARSVILTH